jgi:predicted ArsR family transcriptional regulator
MLKAQLLDSSRGRIVTQLRGTGLTADDLASRLGLMRSAVRAELSAMERDGLVRRAGQRPGTTRPSLIFKLTAEVEQLLSGAYIPLLTQLVDVFAEGLPADQLETLLRKAGQRPAHELAGGERLGRGLRSRVLKASELMNEHLGALTQVQANGEIAIKGAGCPLAALTGAIAYCVAAASVTPGRRSTRRARRAAPDCRSLRSRQSPMRAEPDRQPAGPYDPRCVQTIVDTFMHLFNR